MTNPIYNRSILYGQECRSKMLEGINALADAVAVTLGPAGKNVVIKLGLHDPKYTKDGVTVARNTFFPDPWMNLGAETISGAALRTNDRCGDGPQPLWSKVLTPRGFITMGEVEPGMEICGTNESIQTVVGVYPKGEREIYNVRFANGRVTQCCEDHLWSVVSSRGASSVLPLKDMMADYCTVAPDGYRAHKYYVPSTSVEFISDHKNMPLDPYLVGLLIGDGCLSGSRNIEISLGKAKEHVLGKIKLPEGLAVASRYVENRNYFRVKINGRTPEGLSIADILSRIGLLGTTSDDKHIPRSYLYSSKAHRQMLLQGLLDTDGYINKRGLFEFSTVSSRLAQDFRSLVWSLGKFVTFTTHTRENDPDSYSDKPIYRMQELLGYKHGLKIVGIEPTGNVTEMQCIKVSNSDNLYITDDFLVTHNTTSATVLARALCQKPFDLSQVQIVLENVRAMAKPVSGREDWYNVALVSSNNDVEIATRIADTLEAVGTDGQVTVELSNDAGIASEIVNGMSFGRGYSSPYFVTNTQKMTAELHDVKILILRETLMNLPQIFEHLNNAVKQSQSVLILAPEIGGEAANTLVLNKVKNGVKVCAVTIPTLTEGFLDDIALSVGADIGGAVLGTARKVVVSHDRTIIVEGGGDAEALKERCEYLRANDQRDRLARLSGGVAVIKVGGSTTAEAEERKDRVDDALNATRAAIAEGIVAGGGFALYKASRLLPDGAVKTACAAPVVQILHNAGLDPHTILDPDGIGIVGYDVRRREPCDLLAAGIVDPVKVVCSALADAASVANLVLNTEAGIVELSDGK